MAKAGGGGGRGGRGGSAVVGGKVTPRAQKILARDAIPAQKAMIQYQRNLRRSSAAYRRIQNALDFIAAWRHDYENPKKYAAVQGVVAAYGRLGGPAGMGAGFHTTYRSSLWS